MSEKSTIYEYEGIEFKIRKIIAEEMDCDAARISMTSTLKSLGADSLDAVSIGMAIENAFDIDDYELLELNTDVSLQQLVNIVKAFQ